jgi:hypothetical protein
LLGFGVLLGEEDHFEELHQLDEDGLELLVGVLEDFHDFGDHFGELVFLLVGHGCRNLLFGHWGDF